MLAAHLWKTHLQMTETLLKFSGNVYLVYCSQELNIPEKRFELSKTKPKEKTARMKSSDKNPPSCFKKKKK